MVWINDWSIHLKYMQIVLVSIVNPTQRRPPGQVFGTCRDFWSSQHFIRKAMTYNCTRVGQNIQWQRQTLKIEKTFVFTLFDSHQSANTILGVFHQSNFVNQRITYIQNMYTQKNIEIFKSLRLTSVEVDGSPQLIDRPISGVFY